MLAFFNVFVCTDNTCIKTFLNEQDLECHLATGKHSIDLQGFDRVKEHYLCTVTSCSSMPSTYTESPVASDTYHSYFKEGWVGITGEKIQSFQLQSIKIYLQYFHEG